MIPNPDPPGLAGFIDLVARARANRVRRQAEKQSAVPGVEATEDSGASNPPAKRNTDALQSYLTRASTAQ